MAGPKTALFSRKTPGGVFSIEDQAISTGDRWFVHSGTGATTGGTSPDSPLSTIDAAVGLATASQGDIIFVMPGHNETITAATSLVIDKIGLTIIGLGRGSNRPTLDFDNASGTIEMDAAGCRISNIIFKASVVNVVVCINVDADDCEIDHCFFTYESTGDEFITTIDLDAFDRCHIHDNVIETEDTSGAATRGIRIDETEDSVIENNIFRGFWSDAVIFGEGTLSSRLLVKDNVIYNADTSNYNAIDGGALSSTGQIIGNHITSLYAQAGKVAKVIRLCSFTWANNTLVNAVAEAAVGATGVSTLPITTST